MTKYAQNNYNPTDIVNDIMEKCWEDENFKKQLIASPREAMDDFTGLKMNLSEGSQVSATEANNGIITVVIEGAGTKGDIVFSIPPSSTWSDLELTDQQLETIAGGAVRSCIITNIFNSWSYCPSEMASQEASLGG